MSEVRAGAAASPPGAPTSDIPHSSPWLLFCFCLAGLSLVWLPLAALQQVDALRAFMSWGEQARDIALVLVLLAGLSAGAAGVASACRWGLRRLGARAATADASAWLLCGIPVSLLCAGQLAYDTKQWLGAVIGGSRLMTGPLVRLVFIIALPLVFAVLWRLVGTSRMIRGVVEPVLGLRFLALLGAALAAMCLALRPPMIGDGSADKLSTRTRAAPGSPDILLISLDALAAEDAAICGEGPTRMPQVRRLAARSTCFTRFYAASNTTSPATSTMDTGTLPWSHWAATIGSHVATPLRDVSIGHALQRAGYSTHFIGSVLRASPRQHGTYRGYDSVVVTPSTSLSTSLQNLPSVFPDAVSVPILLTALSSFLSTADIYLNADRDPYPPQHVYDAVPPILASRGRDRPVFVWAHTMQPHAPYLPPKSTKYSLLHNRQLDRWQEMMADNLGYQPALQGIVDQHRLRYRETILGADEQIGNLLDALEREGKLDDAIVIITADHGESFERGFLGHAGELLHEAVVRIPLLIKLPQQRAGRIVDMPASQADLAPTLLALAGAGALPQGEGRSLRPTLLGEPQEGVPVFSMTMQRQSRFVPLRAGQYAVIDGKLKLVHDLSNARGELYDLAADPREQNDLSSLQPQSAARLTALLKAHLAQAEEQRQRWFAPAPIPLAH